MRLVGYLKREVSADHSSRGVLPTVVRRCERSRNLMKEEAMARIGSQRQKKKDIYVYTYIYCDMNMLFNS